MTLRGLVLLLGLVAAARADYEETEHRLKTAGVAPALRQRVHAAIGKGVAYLLGRQLEDGGFDSATPMPGFPADKDGYTALCGLALRHAGTPAAKKGARDAIRFLKGRAGVSRDVYTAGLTLMLLAGAGHRESAARDVAVTLAKAQTRDGWWGYHTGPNKGPFLSTSGNLSTTQFAGLGMWAGARLGAAIPPVVWERHLESLVRFQTQDGSWSYAARAGIDLGYPTGTCMGLANLEIVLAALGSRPDADVHVEQLKIAAEATRAHARRALDRDGARLLFDFRRRRLRDYYALYTLEKACLFADRERVDDVAWYRFGAEILVGAQSVNGSWPVPPRGTRATATSLQRPLTTTSFALLFLLRSSRAYHPTTPRRPDLSRGPVTGRPRPAPPDEPVATPPAPAPAPPVPLAEARVRLLTLAARLDDRRAEADEILAAVRAVGSAYGRVRPDDAGWRDAAHTLLLRAVGAVRAEKSANELEAVNVLAAEALARAPAATTPALLDTIGKAFLRDRGFRPGAALFEAVFATLTAHGHPDAAPWLVWRVIDNDPREEHVARTRAALDALYRMRRPDGKTRRRAVTRIVRLFADVEKDAVGILVDARDRRRAAYWSRMRVPVLKVLDHFTRAPKTGEPARAENDGWLARVADYARWLPSHANPDAAPWR